MTGKTVDEAVEAACASLELLRDEVNVEILEMPQKRLFGVSLAKVRVYANSDNFSMNDLLSPKENKQTEEISSKQSETPIEKDIEKETEEDQKKKSEVVLQKSNDDLKERESENEVAHIPQTTEIKTEKPVDIQQEEKDLAFESMPISAQAAFSYLIDVTSKMNLQNISFKAVEVEGGVKFMADGDDAALLIGRRGETMEALQYLCLLVGNRVGGEYCKISLDVANYRIRREQSLESQAKRVADKVLKTRRSQTLDSMSSYERRIIHSTIQTIKGVQSESIGSDPNRRVVIYIEGDRSRSYQRGGYRGRDGNSSGSRNRPNNQKRTVDTQKKQEQPKEQNELLEKNLYGKIDI